MRSSLGWLSWGALFLVASGCGEQASVSRAALTVPKGAFATIGDRALSLELLTTPPEARKAESEAVIREILLGDEAARSLPHRARAVERGVLGRSLVERLEQELLREAPVKEADLQAQRAKEWVKYERPRSVRTAQFFVPVGELSPGDHEHALAERIHEAVKGATNIDQFVTLGKAIETELKVIVEPAPAVAADGRVVPINTEEARFVSTDEVFARAASSLRAPGDISGVVVTQDGFHVLYAMEVFSSVSIPIAEARRTLTKAILAERLDARLQTLKEGRKEKVVRVRTEFASALRPFWRER
jgi:hypothetical protein